MSGKLSGMVEPHSKTTVSDDRRSSEPLRGVGLDPIVELPLSIRRTLRGILVLMGVGIVAIALVIDFDAGLIVGVIVAIILLYFVLGWRVAAGDYVDRNGPMLL